jgi:hypothetical protein
MLIPVIFGRSAPHMVDASRVASGDRVLDVGWWDGALPGRLQTRSLRPTKTLIWTAMQALTGDRATSRLRPPHAQVVGMLRPIKARRIILDDRWEVQF